MKKYSLLLGLCTLLFPHTSEAAIAIQNAPSNQELLVSNALYLGSIYLVHGYTPRNRLLTAYTAACGVAATGKTLYSIWKNYKYRANYQEWSDCSGLCNVFGPSTAAAVLAKYGNSSSCLNSQIASRMQAYNERISTPLTEVQNKQLEQVVRSEVEKRSQELAAFMMSYGLYAHWQLCNSSTVNL